MNPFGSNIQQRMLEMRRGRIQSNLQPTQRAAGYQIPRQPGAVDGGQMQHLQKAQQQQPFGSNLDAMANAMQGQMPQQHLQKAQQPNYGSNLDSMVNEMRGQMPQAPGQYGNMQEELLKARYQQAMQQQTQPPTQEDPNHMGLQNFSDSMKAGFGLQNFADSMKAGFQAGQSSPNPMSDKFRDAAGAGQMQDDAQPGGYADLITRIKGALPQGMNIHPMDAHRPDVAQLGDNQNAQKYHPEGSAGHLNTFMQNAIRHGFDPTTIAHFIKSRGVGIPRQPIQQK